MLQTQSSPHTPPRVTVIEPRALGKAKLRVAAYARVSSDSEDQINSYIAQVDFYTKYISSKEDWEMVDIYADEGLTGMESRKRDDFNRMLADCRAGKIDRVLVKSVSRFARNTKEYIQYMRELLRLGISIYFEKENLDTAKMTTEQAADLYGAFAQMETTNHSDNMRISNRIRMEKGIFTPPTPPFGYRLVNCELEIDQEEAKVVRHIFRSYLAGQGKEDIAKTLNAKKVVGRRGSLRWYYSTVDYILTNISYTGNMIWQKTCATDMVKRMLENEVYLGNGMYPRLISNEDFLAVRLRRAEKTTEAACPGEITDIRKKAVCACCGSRMKRGSRTRGRVYWHCENEACGQAVSFLEEDFQKSLTALLKKVASDPKLLTPAKTGRQSAPSMDAIRIENELNLAFNRGTGSAELIRALIFASAAESYAAIPDPSPVHTLTALRKRLEAGPADEAALREIMDKTVRAIRMDGKGISLELINGAIVALDGKEEQTA